MATKVPFPYISGSLDDRSRFELERNFQYLTDQITSTVTGWDAMVDPTATADNTTTLVFTTPFRAITYLYNTKGLRSMSIGVISRDGATMTETGNLAGITNASIRLGVVGWQSSRTAGSHTVSWNLATFTFTGAGTTVNVTGLTLKGGATTQYTFQNPQFYASFCQVGDGTTQRWHSGGNYFDCVYSGAADGIFWNCQCQFTSGTVSGTLSSFVVIGGWIQSSGGVSITISTDNVYVNSAMNGSSSGGSLPDIFIIGSAKALTWITPNNGSDGTGLQSVPAGLNVTSAALRKVHIEGFFTALVVPALAAPLVGACTVRADIYGYNTGTLFGVDITGPAQIEINSTSQIAAAGGGVVVLRGFGLNGSVTLTNTETANALTLLKVIGMQRSVLTVATKRDSGSGATTGTKVYDIDAASANNVLIVEADAFGTASANASATTLVITDAGVPSAPSGPAGGDLAGSTYPNPVVAANVITNAKLAQMAASTIKGNNTAGVANAVDLTVAQVKVLLAFIATGDAAGGSLAGTFPSPTFAGRFPSVAELDKDFTKSFLLGTL